jgi:hypothetical protein
LLDATAASILHRAQSILGYLLTPMGIIIAPIFIIYIATAIACLLVLFGGVRNSEIGIKEWGSGLALLLAILGSYLAVWELSISSLWFADAFWLCFALLPIAGLSLVGIVVKFQIDPSPRFRFRAVIVFLAISISPFIVYGLAMKQPGFSFH